MKTEVCGTSRMDFFTMCFALPDGRNQRLKVRSMVGLLPLCAVTVYNREMREKYPDVGQQISNFLSAKPELTAFIHNPGKPGQNGRLLASVLNETNLRRVLTVMLDEKGISESIRYPGAFTDSW